MLMKTGAFLLSIQAVLDCIAYGPIMAVWMLCVCVCGGVCGVYRVRQSPESFAILDANSKATAADAISHGLSCF